MKLDEYAQYDGTALAEMVRRKDIHPEELATLALTAIEQLNPQLNAVIETYKERAQPHSMTADNSEAFCGVPFLLKDTGATDAGKPQECGSRLGKGYIADSDSFLTQRYKSAGFNILGRTTMPELAQAATTESAHSGATRNPWNLGRSTGGSSGGAAAAVASGMVPVAHGTDTGGSIRIPAACCGVVGLKPTRGRISKGPMLDETLYGGLNTEHVLTRSLRDTAAVLDASCAPGPGDPFTISQPSRPFLDELHLPTGPLRLAFSWKTHTGVPVAPEMAAAVRQIASVLSDMGHHLEENFPAIDGERYARADDIVWASSTAREVQRLSLATGHPSNELYLERPTLEALEMANTLSINHWFEAMETYNQMNRRIAAFFQHYDLVLTPTVASLAPPLGTLNSNKDISFTDFMAVTGAFCPHTALFNVTGQPAISLPLCHSEAGLPIGIQLVARYGDEATLLRLASQLEQAMPWKNRLPPTHVSRLNE